MRGAFDEFPTAHGRLHDPVVWLSVRTWVGGVHVPVKRQLPVLRTDLCDCFSELRFHRRGGGAGITAQVDIDLRCRRGKCWLVGPATTDRRNGALGGAETGGIAL